MLAGSRVDSTMHPPGVPLVIAAAPSQKLGRYSLAMNWWRARAASVMSR
jgi:hypothetical protein